MVPRGLGCCGLSGAGQTRAAYCTPPSRPKCIARSTNPVRSLSVGRLTARGIRTKRYANHERCLDSSTLRSGAGQPVAGTASAARQAVRMRPLPRPHVLGPAHHRRRQVRRMRLLRPDAGGGAAGRIRRDGARRCLAGIGRLVACRASEDRMDRAGRDSPGPDVRARTTRVQRIRTRVEHGRRSVMHRKGRADVQATH